MFTLCMFHSLRGRLAFLAWAALCLIAPAFSPQCSAEPRFCLEGEVVQSGMHIYFYDSTGSPVDVSAFYQYVEGHVYDLDWNLVGYVPDYVEGHVYGVSGGLIGFISST